MGVADGFGSLGRWRADSRGRQMGLNSCCWDTAVHMERERMAADLHHGGPVGRRRHAATASLRGRDTDSGRSSNATPSEFNAC
jgi:hypothetical protein